MLYNDFIKTAGIDNGTVANEVLGPLYAAGTLGIAPAMKYTDIAKAASADDWINEEDRSYKRFKRHYDEYVRRQAEKQRFVRSAALPIGVAGALGMPGGPETMLSSILIAAGLEGIGWRNLEDKEAARYALNKMHRKIPASLEGVNTYYD